MTKNSSVLKQLTAKWGAERARLFCEIMPEVESDDELLELIMIVPGDSKIASDLAWFLLSALTYKRKAEGEKAQYFIHLSDEERQRRFPWLSKGKGPLPDIVDVVDREQFRNIVRAVAMLAAQDPAHAT